MKWERRGDRRDEKELLRTVGSRLRSLDFTLKTRGSLRRALSRREKWSHMTLRRDRHWLGPRMSKSKTGWKMRDAVEIYTWLIFILPIKTIKLFMDLKLHCVHFTLPVNNHLWSIKCYAVPREKKIQKNSFCPFSMTISYFIKSLRTLRGLVFTFINFSRPSNLQETARIRKWIVNKFDMSWWGWQGRNSHFQTNKYSDKSWTKFFSASALLIFYVG